jgi:alkylmercury lyase
MTVDAAGLVTGSHGLSLVPSEHRVTFDLGVRHVWCAVDAVGIPAAMGVDARVESRCFHCSAAVSLTMSGGEPRGPESMSLRIGLAVAGCTGKVIEDVCPMLNFFCSLEHADRWATTVVGASIITVRQAAEMGRRTWSDIAPG